MEIKTAELEKLSISLAGIISQEMLLDAKVEFVATIGGDIVYQLRGYLWSESQKQYVFEKPTDWWQAFKEHWFPAWAKKRWPVGYEVHTIDLKVIYPDLKVSVPGERYTVILKDFPYHTWRDGQASDRDWHKEQLKRNVRTE